MKHKIPLAVVIVPLVFVGSCRRPLALKVLDAGVSAACADRWDDAEAYWKNALGQNPGSAAAHNTLAVAYEKKGAWEEARKEYEAAFGLAPDNPTIKENFERFKRRQESAKTDKGPAARGGTAPDRAPWRGR